MTLFIVALVGAGVAALWHFGLLAERLVWVAAGVVAAVVAVWWSPWTWLAVGPLGAVAAWMALRWAAEQVRPAVDRVRHLAVLKPTSARQRARASRRRQRHGHMASGRDVRRVAGAGAVCKEAATIRPSLTVVAARRRATIRPAEVAVPLCKVGGRWAYATHELVTLYLAGPRKGKTAALSGAIVDHPGSSVVTSTRADLYHSTATHREARGPVYLFNAAGLPGARHQVTFNPLHGCEDPATAMERVEDMLPPLGDAGAEEWTEHARGALASLMHAAAIGDGLSMDDVQRWVAQPNRYLETIVDLLRRSPSPATLQDALQFLTTNPKTQSSITTHMRPALSWLKYDVARAAAGLSEPGVPAFDAARLLDTTATLYIVGRVEDQCAALLAALTGHVAREARRAATRRGGRLDPALALHLDEAYNFAPPLDNWTTDMGGFGIAIFATFQSRQQLLDTYGENKAGVILNNAGAVLIGGGTKDPDDLAAWSSLLGQRDVIASVRDRHGRAVSGSDRPDPVMSAAELSEMGKFRVLLLRDGMPPALGRIVPLWRRTDIAARAYAHELLDQWEERDLRHAPRVVEGAVVEPATVDHDGVEPVPVERAAVERGSARVDA